MSQYEPQLSYWPWLSILGRVDCTRAQICCLVMQGGDLTPYVVVDGKLITGQNPAVRHELPFALCEHMSCCIILPGWQGQVPVGHYGKSYVAAFASIANVDCPRNHVHDAIWLCLAKAKIMQ